MKSYGAAREQDLQLCLDVNINTALRYEAYVFNYFS